MSDTVFDYIIVGAGTAGCLLANRLSAYATKRVLLIEAGRRDDDHWIHIPVGYLQCIGNPRTDWLFSTEPEAGLAGRALRYPRGKTLGGSSSINGMIYMRGQARDYNAWAQLTQDASWSWDNSLPYFKLHEDHYKGATALHGARGTAPELMQDVSTPYRQAYNQVLRHRNSGGEWRVDKQHLRWNTAKAFLRPTCYARPNFELWTDAQATHLLLEPANAAHANPRNNPQAHTDSPPSTLRCTGVRVWDGAEMVNATARLEVLLCAGSIASPQILQLSGLGPAALLQARGVPVVHDMPGVGANLQDHLQIRTVFKVHNTTTLNTQAHSLWGKARMALQYALKRSDPDQPWHGADQDRPLRRRSRHCAQLRQHRGGSQSSC
jgi:choline dehydrogenase